MKIKPKYFIEKDAPLNYYSFLKVLVIIWIIVSVARLFTYITEDNTIGIIEIAILLLIQIFVAIGLYKREWKGVIALYCMYIYNILDFLLALGIYAYYDLFDAYVVGEIIGGIMGVLIWAIPTWIYFSKRRPLFKPYEKVSENVATTAEPSYDAINNNKLQNMITIEEQSEEIVNFCNKCGFKLLDNSSFCSKCGAEIPKRYKQ